MTEEPDDSVILVQTPDPKDWKPIFENFTNILSLLSLPADRREGVGTSHAVVMEQADTYHRHHLRQHGVAEAILSDPKAAYVALGVFEATSVSFIGELDSMFENEEVLTGAEIMRRLLVIQQTLGLRLSWLALVHEEARAALEHPPVEEDREPFGGSVLLEEMPPDPLPYAPVSDDDDEDEHDLGGES